MGRRSDDGWNGVDGEVDDVQYYAVVLNETDIKWLHEHPGLTVYDDGGNPGTVLLVR